MVQAKWSCIIDRGSHFHSVIRLCAVTGRTAYDHIKCSLTQVKRRRKKERERESSPQEKYGPSVPRSRDREKKNKELCLK